MRLLLITTLFGLVAGSATAASVEAVVSGSTDNASVATISCAECPPLQTKKKVTYVVPTIGAQGETVELKEINGEMRMVRTEAWLGGSPVVFVSKPPKDVIKAATSKSGDPAVATAATAADGDRPEAHDVAPLVIDQTAKTAAVGASMSEQGSRQFDPNSLELRLD